MSYLKVYDEDLRVILQEVACARHALSLTPKGRKKEAEERLAWAEQLAVRIMKRMKLG